MSEPPASPATYGVLGMLATRPWTGYELTHQVRRSLRFIWPVSEGHLYREQRRLVELGWATVEEEPVGRRSRKRYAITPRGRRALTQWLATDPQEPHLQIEGLLRVFYADSAGVEDLASSLSGTAAAAREMVAELRSYVGEYLEAGGPLAMLEEDPAERPREFHGRPVFPERLHVVALTVDATTRLLEELERFCTAAAEEVASWPSTRDAALTAATRARLEALRDRQPPGARTPRAGPPAGMPDRDE